MEILATRRRHKFTSPSGALILNSLVDIALALVIGFIITIPYFFESGIFVNTPAVAKGGQASDIKANIHLSDDGRIILNEEVVSYEKLQELLPELLKRSVERKVTITSDKHVLYDDVIRILDLAKQSGAGQLCLLRKR
ncbi:MAG TPA: biopolymer transporter ExbD [bacterium (Candidatus Stahlbacteria)]|nr:biopolymer transporter ExbD [Candidatus Stahlbacteria bacterium]